MKKIRKTEMMKEAEKGKLNNIGFILIVIFIAMQIGGTIASIYILNDMWPTLKGIVISGQESGQSCISFMKLVEKYYSNRTFLLINLFSTILISLTILYANNKVNKRNTKSLGLTKKKAIRQYLIGCLVGFVLIGATYGINVATGALEFNGINSNSSEVIAIIVVFGIGYILQGAEEELVCRGYMMNGIGARKGIFIAVLGNSIFFSLLHCLNSNFSIIAAFNIFLFGILMSLYVVDFNNLWGVCAIHSVWNFFQGNILGIQVSGMGITDSVVNTSTNVSKELLNGGSFGAEGGIVATGVLSITILVLLIIYFKNKKTITQEV